jgi:hypothetical protein
VRLIRIIITTLASIALLLSLALAAIAYAPDQSLSFIAKRFVNTSDLTVTNIQGASLDHNSLAIEFLTIDTPDYKIEVGSLSASFALAALFRGKFKKVTLGSVAMQAAMDAQLQPQTTGSIGDSSSLQDWLTLVASPPIDELVLENLTVLLPQDSVTGRFSFSDTPPSIEGQFALLSLPGLSLSLTSSISANEPLQVTLILTEGAESMLESQATVTLGDNSIALESDSQLDIQALIGLGWRFSFLPPVTSPTANLKVQAKLAVNNLSSSPTVNAVELIINNQAGLLELSLNRASEPIAVAAALPIALNSNSQITEDLFNINSSAIDLVVTGQTAGLLFDTTVNARNLSLICGLELDCRVNAAVAVNARELQAPSWSANAAALDSSIEIDFAGERIVFTGTDSMLQLNAGVFGEANTSFTANLQQWHIERSGDEPIAAQMQFELTDWSLSYGSYSLNRPLVSGLIGVSANDITATLDGSLQSEFKFRSQLTTNIESGVGSVSFDIPLFSFGSERTLSSYVLATDSPFDIIAGDIAASGTATWSTPSTGSLLLSGPLNFTAENLSGVYADSYFLSLTTSLAAQFTNPMGLMTTQVQSVSISTAELGLPIRDISWDYEFDSTDNSMAIYQLTGSLLGGKVIIPQAKFQDFTSNTALTVIISDIDLTQVTALAEYPGLAVEGFVSGYLPINLQGGAITMQEGLVSSLNPGGSIRYTPLSSSTNSSVKLVNEALSNYQFKSLDSELQYDESGDLNMQVQLRGGNPNMPGGQQINLNLSIINNIPDMLESLRASRSITDAMERNLQRRQ